MCLAIPDQLNVGDVIPIVVTVDLLGWYLRLGRSIEGLADMQKSMENIRNTETVDEPQVLRLVAEYDNKTSGGIPIHNCLYNRWHAEIDSLWKKRQASS